MMDYSLDKFVLILNLSRSPVGALTRHEHHAGIATRQAIDSSRSILVRDLAETSKGLIAMKGCARSLWPAARSGAFTRCAKFHRSPFAIDRRSE
jgi:hypothetical protein